MSTFFRILLKVEINSAAKFLMRNRKEVGKTQDQKPRK